jgi:hypothetical protein
MYIIENLEISEDIIELNWDAAIALIKDPVEKNNPYRLPTKAELTFMYSHKVELDLVSNIYWSSEEFNDECAFALFSSGILNGWFKEFDAMVRLVRII